MLVLVSPFSNYLVVSLVGKSECRENFILYDFENLTEGRIRNVHENHLVEKQSQ